MVGQMNRLILVSWSETDIQSIDQILHKNFPKKNTYKTI